MILDGKIKGSDQVTFAASPIVSHLWSGVQYTLQLVRGMPIVLTATKFNFNLLKDIFRHRSTHLMVVPPQVVLFCKLSKSMTSVTYCTICNLWCSSILSSDLSRSCRTRPLDRTMGPRNCALLSRLGPLTIRAI
ncbi:hypothetical protein BS17DRAFT_432669 [Gyrodon lividus]|nr:hypothetical protein BS17DRAFT_432669 [Gyrodon lividus]